jgi:hypothetical protein
MVRCYEQINIFISKEDRNGVAKKVLVSWLVGLLISFCADFKNRLNYAKKSIWNCIVFIFIT